MSTITVIGGTGYAGSAIVAQAVKRGHTVTALSRSAPETQLDGVHYMRGSALDAEVFAESTDGADVIVSAVAARGDTASEFGALSQALAERADAVGAQLIVIGGFSSLRPAAGETRFVEGEVPEQYVVEAKAGHGFLTMLQESPRSLNYVFISPAAKFGSWVPGEPTGTYTIGDDVAILDPQGSSYLHADDLALAVLDLLDSGNHRRGHISVVS